MLRRVRQLMPVSLTTSAYILEDILIRNTHVTEMAICGKNCIILGKELV